MAGEAASYAVERMSMALENRVKLEYSQMRACLLEADAQEDPDQGFKDWRDQLRKIALAAHDVIVDFDIHFECPPLCKACCDICTLRDRRRLNSLSAAKRIPAATVIE